MATSTANSTRMELQASWATTIMEILTQYLYSAEAVLRLRYVPCSRCLHACNRSMQTCLFQHLYQPKQSVKWLDLSNGRAPDHDPHHNLDLLALLFFQTGLRVVFELKKKVDSAAHFQAMVTLLLANYHSPRCVYLLSFLAPHMNAASALPFLVCPPSVSRHCAHLTSK
jgi:hypothetical protein